jgi:hypothetical protein
MKRYSIRHKARIEGAGEKLLGVESHNVLEALGGARLSAAQREVRSGRP